ncbi:uncharacterized protein DUF2384 [Permianibacter aggregans]|uniref:Uncharacterized protein DUF2384 n=2 Tax=Permianibacter aggregans TaxID=1510150 RepID=A0A4R6UPA7_9GAMM|nr:uncharacterized protein DUF2384 [Permianibacter aggregans]
MTRGKKMDQQVNEKQLETLGHSVFGSADKYQQWLDTENMLIEARKPKELLFTEEGRSKIFGLLIALKESFPV